ncbi:hypothetical protein [Marinobacter sp. MBR-105]|jgi:hypothetical protein
MISQTPETIDLRKRHERICINGTWIRFKQTETVEGTFYVPSFISLPSTSRKGWRLRLARATPRIDRYIPGDTLEAALYQAWHTLVHILQRDPLGDHPARGIQKSIATGETGVTLSMAKPNQPQTFYLRVYQSIESDRAHNEIFWGLASHGLNRELFNACYRRAVAARRYYAHLRHQHYRLKDPIKADATIPDEFLPETLPAPNLFDSLLNALGNYKE